uniref:Uncharacterized protein n=1 Tax=Kalanchoe fedtschenkoi TaxID=63787 RepID=A0A7N0RCW2_KALFE
MSSITMSNETIYGIVCRVKRRSSSFLTETQHPGVGASGWAWRCIGNPNFFIRSRFFSRPPAPA